jgi:hypothetical protein
MRALELFAGVGGITHGLRGYVEPIAFVEYEKDAAEFLATRGKPVHGDVREFDATEYKGNIDIVTAGWPCTGFSTGGKGGGFDHEASGLFVEVVRPRREDGAKDETLVDPDAVLVLPFRLANGDGGTAQVCVPDGSLPATPCSTDADCDFVTSVVSCGDAGVADWVCRNERCTASCP